MARRKKVTTPTMVAADGHGGCCEGAVIGRSGDGEPLLRRERDASDSDLVTVMLVMLGALKKPFFETVAGNSCRYGNRFSSAEIASTSPDEPPYTHTVLYYTVVMSQIL